MPKAAAQAPPPAPIENPFDPPVAVAPAPKVVPQELLARLARLQQDAQAADRERASAETLLAAAKKDLEAIDAQLAELGVDPATADEALTRLEAELVGLVAQFEKQVAEERAAYAAIAAAAQ